MDFFETRAGANLLTREVPRFIEALERIANAMERANEIQAAQLNEQTPMKDVVKDFMHQPLDEG